MARFTCTVWEDPQIYQYIVTIKEHHTAANNSLGKKKNKKVDFSPVAHSFEIEINKEFVELSQSGSLFELVCKDAKVVTWLSEKPEFAMQMKIWMMLEKEKGIPVVPMPFDKMMQNKKNDAYPMVEMTKNVFGTNHLVQNQWYSINWNSPGTAQYAHFKSAILEAVGFANEIQALNDYNENPCSFVGVIHDNPGNDLSKKLPGVDEWVRPPCNCFGQWIDSVKVWSLIQHLNDTDKWTRGQIADWLDSLNIDIAFKVEND